MDYLLPTFKAVSVIFAVSAVGTGAQAILAPVGFSKMFGLPVTSKPNSPSTKEHPINPAASVSHLQSTTTSYISLLGIRQLSTGLILLTFAYQDKWVESATILAIIGVLVAGTDGIYLARSGARSEGRWHAIPGALIAALAAAVVYYNP